MRRQTLKIRWRCCWNRDRQVSPGSLPGGRRLVFEGSQRRPSAAWQAESVRRPAFITQALGRPSHNVWRWGKPVDLCTTPAMPSN